MVFHYLFEIKWEITPHNAQFEKQFFPQNKPLVNNVRENLKVMLKSKATYHKGTFCLAKAAFVRMHNIIRLQILLVFALTRMVMGALIMVLVPVSASKKFRRVEDGGEVRRQENSFAIARFVS